MYTLRAGPALLIGCVVASAAGATIVPIAQDRHIYVQSRNGTERIDAVDFGLFHSFLPGSARQYSLIEPTLIHGDGGSSMGEPPEWQSGASTCSVTLMLDEESEYRFAGEVRGHYGLAHTFSTARLGGPGGVIHEFLAAQGGPDQIDFDVSGVLSAGEYTIFLSTLALNGLHSSAVGEYDANLWIPEPSSAAMVFMSACWLCRRR